MTSQVIGPRPCRRTRRRCTGAATALWAAVALLAAPSARAAERFDAEWASQPSAAEFAAAEAEIRRKGVGGRAVMQCAVKDDGALSGCKIVRETPQAAGFGEALLSLAPKYRRKPPGRNDAREVTVSNAWFPFDSPPDWSRRPTAAELLAVYPVDAYRRGIGGRAVVSCLVTVQGALRDCVAVHESPPGSGFGHAAIALTPQFTMKAARLKGAPVPSAVNIPINWEPTGGGPAPVGSKRVVTAALPWAEAPSYADVVAAYPKKARDAKVGGRATLACDMTEEGTLKSCDIANARPDGRGFEAAAKSLAKLFRLPVVSEQDRKTARGLSIHLPVTFDPAMLSDAEPVIGKPAWAALPDGDLLHAAFAKLGVKSTVRVVLSCTVQKGGVVGACSVVSEEPAGAGLGAAAVALASSFRLTTWTSEGLPTIGGKVRIPLRYEPGDAGKAAEGAPK